MSLINAIFLILVVPAITTVVGASPITNTTSFTAYENVTEGIKIDYPKDWTLIRQYGLNFLSPKESSADTFREGLIVSKGEIVNEAIAKLADRVIRYYNSSLRDFHLIDSKGIMFHDSPAHSLIYTFSIPNNGTIKTYEFGTTEHNRIHVFRYTAQENKFDSYLPIINRMIDSFISKDRTDGTL